MRTLAILTALVFAGACSSTPTPEPVPEPGPQPAPEPAPEGDDDDGGGDELTFAKQVAQGQELYGANCASCHGAAGEGGKTAPAVVGLDKGALPLDPPKGAKHRKEQFKTVLDVGTFVMKNMPPGKGGSLSNEEYVAILAFDLKANGIELDAPLTVEKAGTLDVPR